MACTCLEVQSKPHTYNLKLTFFIHSFFIPLALTLPHLHLHTIRPATSPVDMAFLAISFLPTPTPTPTPTSLFLSSPLLTCHSTIHPSIKPSHFLTTHLSTSTPFKTLHLVSATGDGGSGSGSGGSGGGGGDHNDDDDAADKNRAEALLVLAEAGRSLDSLPNDLSLAVQAGRIPASILHRYFDLHNSPFFSCLLNFGGFKERLLADDLFLTKVAIECGIGIFTKSAAELKKRKENFSKELDFVTADVIMALVADFMLVWLPAPTIPLRPALAISVGPVARFFYACPDNAFQIAFGGTKYSLIQRVGALVRNGAKLFAVGASASVVGTGVTNLLINIRKGIDKTFAAEAEDIPMLPTSIAYGTYMSVSANLRYQVIAGLIEQRLLEPLLHQHKLALSAICFIVRTGNTFLGSLMWVDFARLVGVQRTRD